MVRVFFFIIFFSLLGLGVASVVQGVGGIGLAAGSASAARPVSPEDAAKATGSVAVRGMPEVADPIVIEDLGSERGVLYFEHNVQETKIEKVDGEEKKKRTLRVAEKRWVPSFKVGPVEVAPEKARPEQLRALGQATRGGKTNIYRGVWADEDVTVVGAAKDGKIEGGDPFIVSPRPREELLAVIGKGGNRVFIIAGALLSLVGFLGLIALAVLSARKRV